jgi:hypothetical protein
MIEVRISPSELSQHYDEEYLLILPLTYQASLAELQGLQDAFIRRDRLIMQSLFGRLLLKRSPPFRVRAVLEKETQIRPPGQGRT